MTAKEFVKILLAKEAITLKELARLASENSDKMFTLDGLSHKMRLGTLRFEDVELFTRVLGYKIELKKLPKSIDYTLVLRCLIFFPAVYNSVTF